MPGFDINRFIDLNQSLTNNLICSICHDVFNNAVITLNNCVHTFCKDCVQQWIDSNQNECPECRQKFDTRKRSNTSRDDNNLVIIRNFIFKRNLIINNLINEMKIKCDFDFNGCQQTLKLSQLSAHIKVCEHRTCLKCGLTFGNIEEHNFFELLNKNINDWKEKYEKQLEINYKLKEENTENETKLQTNEKTINDLKENYEKSLKDIKQLKDNISILKTKSESKENEIKKLINKNDCKEKQLLEFINKLKVENKTKLQTNEKTINELKTNYDNSVKDRNQWKLNFDNQLEINNQLKEDISEYKTKLQTNEKTIEIWKQKSEKIRKDINQLKERPKIKTEFLLKYNEIKKLNKQLTENENMFKEIIQKSFENVYEFCDISSYRTLDPKREVRQYLSGLLLLAKHFNPSKYCIQFGNYITICKSVSFEDKVLKLNSIQSKTNFKQSVDLELSLTQLQEVIYTLKNSQNSPSFSILLKTDKQSCDSIGKTLGFNDLSFNDYIFDVNSKDLKTSYIAIWFDCKKRLLFDCCLRYLELSKLQIKIEEKVLKH